MHLPFIPVNQMYMPVCTGQTDTLGRHRGNGYGAIRNLLCTRSSINSLAIKDCHSVGSRRLSDAQKIKTENHSVESLYVNSLDKKLLNFVYVFSCPVTTLQQQYLSPYKGFRDSFFVRKSTMSLFY